MADAQFCMGLIYPLQRAKFSALLAEVVLVNRPYYAA
jgi:hypothetical protein